MKIRLSIESILCLSIVMLVLSNSTAVIAWGLGNVLEYFGYFIILVVVFASAYKGKVIKKNLLFFLVVMSLFSIGIIYQNMLSSIKIRLIFTMLVIAACSILSEKLIRSTKLVYKTAQAIIVGCIISSILAIVSGKGIFDISHEGFFSFGISLGLQFKNFFASDILANYMCLAFVGKIVNENYKKKFIKIKMMMILDLALIFFSNSRGCYVLTLIFIAFFYWDEFVIMSRTQKFFIGIIGFMLIAIIGYEFYNTVALNSVTYMYRINGFQNYLEYIVGDTWHLLFGNAALAYGTPGISYTDAIRRATGFDGSLEFALLNILIKNGLLGVIGYILIFIRFIKKAFKCKNSLIKKTAFSMLIVLLASSFVESFISNIHSLFGVFTYLIVSSIIGIDSSSTETEKAVNYTR